MFSKPRHVAAMLDLEWPFKRHAGPFTGAYQYAKEQGWKLTIDEYAYDTLPTQRNVEKPVAYDGIIARATKLLAERSSQLDVPVVNVWGNSPVKDLLPGAFADFGATGPMIAEHLLSRGFRNFSALISAHSSDDELQKDEFRRVVGEAGYSCTHAKVAHDWRSTLTRWRKTEESIVRWMDKWQLPIGIYCSNEIIGRIVAQTCRERGWRVPEDVAIVAGHNDLIHCQSLAPSLTSVELGYERVGYEAARLLDQLMDEKEQGNRKNQREAPEHILVPPTGLVIRESTDFHVVNDEVVSAALKFIAENFHLPIGVAEVARAVATESRTLQALFRKYLDRPIATEIRRIRLERAKREVAQTKRPLAQISRDVGFGGGTTMYEVFRRELKMTPREYRKQRTK